MMPSLGEKLRGIVFPPLTLAWLFSPPLKSTFTGNPLAKFSVFSTCIISDKFVINGLIGYFILRVVFQTEFMPNFCISRERICVNCMCPLPIV